MEVQNMEPKEYKVRSFRADDETFEKFKALASEEFGNQGQCLASLISLYETEKSKAVLVERKIEIENFQAHANKIIEMFLMSLQLNEDAEERIRSEFEHLLNSKDRIITDLQTKEQELNTSNELYKETAKEAEQENYRLLNQISELEKHISKQNREYETALADKDSLNKALTDSCNDKKIEIEELKTRLSETLFRLSKLDEIEDQNNKLATENSRLVAEIEKQKEYLVLEKERAILAAEKEHQKELKEVQVQHQKELKGYIGQIEKLQEQRNNTINEITELKLENNEFKGKIKELEAIVADLREELAKNKRVDSE
jgi:DNA anti-recombination protein RmuC